MRASTHRLRRSLAIVLVAIALALALGTPGAVADDGRSRSSEQGRQTASIELVAQSPTVAPGGAFELAVRTAGLPEDAYLVLRLRGRVRSRSELHESMAGDGLRSQVHSAPPQLVSSLPTDAQGSRRLGLSLDPAVPGGIRVTAAGAYPVEVIAQDAGGRELASFITHLVLRPATTDESPPLNVAVVVDLSAPAALQPDGTSVLDDDDVAELHGLTAALAETTGVMATVAVRPETLDALAADDVALGSELLDLLPTAVAGRAALGLPYVDVSPDDLVVAGLEPDLGRQLLRGAAVVSDALALTPTHETWLADPDLGTRGLRALRAAGVQHVVVANRQVEPLRSGVTSLSLAQPFLLTGADGADTATDAIELDDGVLTHLRSDEAPGLRVSRLVAELSVLWFEQPGIARSAIVPLPRDTDPAVARGLLTALGTTQILRSVSLTEAFTAAEPLRQPGGAAVERSLASEQDGGSIGRELAVALDAQRTRLGSFAGLVGENPRVAAIDSHLLVAEAGELRPSNRQAHVAAAAAAMDAVVGGISAQAQGTITLTDREGSVPLTLRNDTGLPIKVVVQPRSSKLEFPGGESIPLTLTEPSTRLDLAVRTRTSGSVPLDVLITSPDGGLALAELHTSVQSTAISGVGALLSAGAAVFLAVWWARHWRRTRRSAKLVATTHPALRDAQ
jgi:hypothetical protein